jgi:hypothetical protein
LSLSEQGTPTKKKKKEKREKKRKTIPPLSKSFVTCELTQK